VQINASAISGFRQLLKVSKILPPVLKALSEATVETGVANTSLAILDKTGNLAQFCFHHKSRLKLSSSSTLSSAKYFSSSFLLPIELISFK
jgi:hypothetical protein